MFFYNEKIGTLRRYIHAFRTSKGSITKGTRWYSLSVEGNCSFNKLLTSVRYANTISDICKTC